MSEVPDILIEWSDEMTPNALEVIPWRYLKEGVERSLRNAARLLADAQLLSSKERDASAVVLYVAAWEETGRAILLLRHWVNQEDVKGKPLERIFKSHQAKRTALFDNIDFLYGDRHHRDRAEIKNFAQKLKQYLRWSKEVLGLYVNWMGEKRGWSSPDRKPMMAAFILSSNVHEILDSATKQAERILKGI